MNVEFFFLKFQLSLATYVYIYTVCMCMRNSVCLELCVLHNIVQHMDVYVMSDTHMCVFTSTSSACRIYVHVYTHVQYTIPQCIEN